MYLIVGRANQEKHIGLMSGGVTEREWLGSDPQSD
jgi:hypothetical protein